MAVGSSARVVAGNDAIARASNKTHPQWWKDPGLRRLNILLFGVMLGSIGFGFDQALIGGLEADPRWFTDLKLGSASLQGVVIAGVSIGGLLAPLPAAYMVDYLGRKWSIIISNIALIGGAVGQAFASTAASFLGTRILLGFFSVIVAVSSPTLLAELAHPRQRGPATAMYMTFFYLGGITAAWTCYGALNIVSSWSWRLPVIIQVAWASVQFVWLFFCPESPRWLISKGREAEALQILAKYHANGDENDEMVQLEYHEIMAQIRAEAGDMHGLRGWLDLVSSHGNLKRTGLTIFMGLSMQWVGNGVISFYLAPVLASIGVTNSSSQQGINGGLQIWNLFMSIIGAMLADKTGRKRLLLISSGGMLLSMIVMTVCFSVYAHSESESAGKAVIVFLFAFFAAYDVGYTPIPTLYVSEIAPTTLRSKYMGLYWFCTAAALTFNQYVNPIALEKLGWKYYLVYVAVLVVVIFILSFFAPETKGLTLEQVSALFNKDAATELIQPVKTVDDSLTAHDTSQEKTAHDVANIERGYELDHIEYS